MKGFSWLNYLQALTHNEGLNKVREFVKKVCQSETQTTGSLIQKTERINISLLKIFNKTMSRIATDYKVTRIFQIFSAMPHASIKPEGLQTNLLYIHSSWIYKLVLFKVYQRCLRSDWCWNPSGINRPCQKIKKIKTFL